MLFFLLGLAISTTELPVYQTYQLPQIIASAAGKNDIYFLVLFKIPAEGITNVSIAFRRLIEAIPLESIKPQLGIVIDPSIKKNSVLYINREGTKNATVEFKFVRMMREFRKSEHLNWHIKKDYEIVMKVILGKIKPPNPNFNMLNAMKRLSYIKNHNRGDLIRDAIELQEAIDDIIPPPESREKLPVFTDIDPNLGKKLPLDDFSEPNQEDDDDDDDEEGGIKGTLRSLFSYFNDKIHSILYPAKRHSNPNEGLNEDAAVNDDVNEAAEKKKGHDDDDEEFDFIDDDDEDETVDDDDHNKAIEDDDDDDNRKKSSRKNRNDEEDDTKRTRKNRDDEDENDTKRTRKNRNDEEDDTKRTRKNRDDEDENDTKRTRKNRNDEEDDTKRTRKNRDDEDENDTKRTRKSRDEDENDTKRTRKNRDDEDENDTKKTRKNRDDEEDEPRRKKEKTRVDPDEDTNPNPQTSTQSRQHGDIDRTTQREYPQKEQQTTSSSNSAPQYGNSMSTNQQVHSNILPRIFNVSRPVVSQPIVTPTKVQDNNDNNEAAKKAENVLNHGIGHQNENQRTSQDTPVRNNEGQPPQRNELLKQPQTSQNDNTENEQARKAKELLRKDSESQSSENESNRVTSRYSQFRTIRNNDTN